MTSATSKLKGPSQRQLKVGEHIRHILSEILHRQDFHDEILAKVSVNISEVRMSPDLRHARVYVLPLASQSTPQVLAALNEHGHRFRQLISKQLTMKFLPRLFFVEDEAFDHSTNIERLLRSQHVAQDLAKEDDREGETPPPDACSSEK